MPVYGMARPRFTAEDLDDVNQRRKIISWLVQLDEHLRYLLENLDEDNVSQEFVDQLNVALSSSVTDDLTGRVTAVETALTVQEGLIESKASQSDMSDLEDRVEVAETVIQQTATGVDVVVSGTNTIKGVTENNETTIQITDSEFIVSTDTINLQAAEGQTLHIDEDGAVMETLTATEKISAPNIVEKYTGDAAITVGTGGTYTSLQAAFEALKGKYLAKNVTITLTEDLYEDVRVMGVIGSNQLTIDGDGYTLQGNMRIQGCAAAVFVRDMDISCQDYGTVGSALAVTLSGSVTIQDVNVTGPGTGTLVAVAYQSYVLMQRCALNGADTLIYVSHSSLDTYNLAGTGTTYLQALGGRITMEGTRPVGTYTATSATLIEPTDPDNTLTADAGSGGVTPETVYTATLTATTTRTYGSDWDNGTTLVQGYVSGQRYQGFAWFDASAIANKTIKTAQLILTRKTGSGRSSAVDVSICFLDKVSSTTDDPSGGQSFDIGTIGTLTPGETGVFSGDKVTLAASNISARPTSAIGIRNSDSAALSGREYSANYAQIEGTEGSAPQLVVTYV